MYTKVDHFKRFLNLAESSLGMFNLDHWKILLSKVFSKNVAEISEVRNQSH
jgi:hypothetical protein